MEPSQKPEMRLSPVSIHGQGVAAACCAFLLDDSGFPVSLTRREHARVPAIVVSRATQALACDIFQRPSLFNGLPRIDRRVVAWGANREPVTLPHEAVVISEEALLTRLPAGYSEQDGNAEWKIFASRPLPEPFAAVHFGARKATAVQAELKTPGSTACWAESLESGWLFLIPGWLIAVGAAPATLLAQSGLVAGQIRAVSDQAVEFPAYPRIADPLCAPGRLACGAAAMAFDPICGDGTGNAVREAILATALIRAAARCEDVESLLAHYRGRLIAGFRRHLELTLEFYRAGNSGPWWEEEIRAMERGVQWCAQQLAALPPFRYRLDGFDLMPINVR